MKKKISPISIVLYLAMLLMLVAKLDVISKMYDLSQMPDMTFYFGVGLQPGVLLPVLGSIMTQFCHFPVIGAILVVLSMAILTGVSKWAFGNKVSAYFPAVFMFSFLVGMDYSIYTMRAQGVLFSQTLGLTLAVLAAGGWTRAKKHSLAYPVLMLLVGYPIIGAYAILAGLAIFAASLFDRREPLVIPFVTLIASAAIPWLYTHFVFTHIDTRYTFFAAAPYMDFVKNGLKFIPLGLSGLAVVLLAMTPNLKLQDSALTGLIATLAMLGAIVAFAYKDRNFHIELAMEQAIEKNEWKKAVKYSAKSPAPTRVIVLYRNIALLNTGQLCDKMFTFPNSGPRINTTAQISQTEVCAPLVFFYNGLINYSTRWAWEMSMMFQRTVERYKYQAKVALFTGQEKPELIAKYLDIIDANWFEGKWVEKYRRYLNDPEALQQDPEYQMFQVLNQFEEIKFMSSAVVEDTLLKHYTSQPAPQGVMLDLALAAAMTMRNTDAFWYYFAQLQESGREMPTHVAEAAILFAYLERDQKLIDSVANVIGVESSVVKKFQAFSGEASGVRDAAAAKETFKKKYGDTYWYYCYFTEELLTD